MSQIILIAVCVFVSVFEAYCMRLSAPPEVPRMRCKNSALGINEWDFQSFETIATEIFKTRLEPSMIANHTLGVNALPIHNQFRGAQAVQLAGLDGEGMMQHYRDICNVIYSNDELEPGIIRRMNNLLGNVRIPLTIDDFIEFIDNISMKSQEGLDVPHIALARAMIIDEGNITYSYPIPYIFVSGRIQNVMNRILIQARASLKNLLGLAQNTQINLINQLATIITNNTQGGNMGPHNLLAQITPIIERSAKFLHIAYSINGGINGIARMCSDVELYGVTSVNNIMNFYHSERAIGLCLCNQFFGMNLANDSINLHNAVYPNAQATGFVVQIKCSLPPCENCQNFWMGNALINAEWQFVRDGGNQFILNLPHNIHLGLRVSERCPVLGFWI